MRNRVLVQSVLVIILFEVLTTIAFAEWPSDPTVNVPICTAEDVQCYLQLASDGAGGAIITWYDWRSGSHLKIATN